VTVYARSDVLHVALSDDHGGCGQSHTRPVVNGAPIKTWALECPACEIYLKTDVLWAGMPSEVPETPDEEKIRLDEERRGQRDAIGAQAQALQQIANLPDGMATAFAQAFADAMIRIGVGSGHPLGLPAAPTATVTCPSGHEVEHTAKFCAECGIEMLPPARIVNGDVVTRDEPLDTIVPTDDLETKGLAELRTIAKNLGVKSTNSRDKQIELIRDALRNGK